MAKHEEKNVDLELLLFYLGISMVSFVLYIYRHPIIYFFFNKDYSYGLLKEYLPDLAVFLSVFIPYVSIIIYFIINKIVRNIKIPDNFFVILFFPILAFFSKGMSLFQIYVDLNIIEVLLDNFAFYMFLFIGPSIIVFNKLIIFLKKNR